MKSIYKRLGLSRKEFRDFLCAQYKTKTQKEIAEFCGCHITVIERWFSKFSIITRTYSERTRKTKKREVVISNGEKQILNGLLLSDLHIERGVFQSRLSFGFKYKGMAEDVCKALPCFSWNKLYQDKNTGCWHSKTSFYEELSNWKNEWYKPNKIIPQDLKITPLTLYWWYLGDGRIMDYGIELCSESFSRKDNVKLLREMQGLGIKIKITPQNRLRICGGNSSKKVKNMIVEFGIPEYYKYKFKFRVLKKNGKWIYDE